MKQQTQSEMEYSCRKKRTKREEFLEIMDGIIPWKEWVEIIRPYYPTGKRGRPPIDLELILRMYLLQVWFNLSDPGTEDAIYDSYAMRKFTGIDFLKDSFRIIKCQFGYRKVRYRGLKKMKTGCMLCSPARICISWQWPGENYRRHDMGLCALFQELPQKNKWNSVLL